MVTYCTKCGTPLVNGVCPNCSQQTEQEHLFCTKCGSAMVNGICPNCSAQTEPQNQQPQKTEQQPKPVEVDPNDERFKSFFMSPKEKFVCALGNGYLMNFLAGGFLGKGFAVISDKRVYFKGKSFEVGENKLKVRTTASTVDLKDVTGTEVRTFKDKMKQIQSIIFMILGVFILFLAIVFSSSNSRTPKDVIILLFIFGSALLLGGIISIIIYLTQRKTLLTIMFGGGGIAFPLNWFPQQEGENFQKKLRIAKDQAIEQAENATANAVREAMSVSVPQPQAAPQPAATSADELAKYAQLYKDGLLSDEEFADIKARLLNNK